MAVIGFLKDISGKLKFDERIDLGLKYLNDLRVNDFNDIDVGKISKVEINGDEVYSVNQVYETKEHSLGKLEGHRKYIDLQFVFEGSEIIKLIPLNDVKPSTDYNEENDIQFFDSDKTSIIEMKSGMLGIFYPEDIHAPGLKSGSSNIVKKAVVKVLL